MTTLGVRCSNKDFTYAVLEGSVKTPSLIALETLTIPPLAESLALHWVIEETTTLIKRHGVNKIVLKASEGGKAGKAYEARVEFEGAVRAAAGALGLKAAFKKRKVTLAKNICGKGKAAHLDAHDTHQ